MTSIQLLSALLIALLLLVQGELLAHETEHAAHGESNSCIQCWIADHQHFASTDINHINLTWQPDSYQNDPITFSYPETRQQYNSRDPPSLHS